MRHGFVAAGILGERKVFCIGRNKTGTTSLKRLFLEQGYAVGSQRKAELLVDDFTKGSYQSLIDYVKKGGEVFQDVPFSLPRIYQVLDEAFPGSKFILSIRNSPEEWYQSLVNFHADVLGKGRIPTREDLVNAEYAKKGYAWQINRFLYNSPEDDPYNEEVLINSYLSHNQDVKEYFSDKPDQLLIVNLAEKGVTQQLNDFLQPRKPFEQIPWEKKGSYRLNEIVSKTH